MFTDFHAKEDLKWTVIAPWQNIPLSATLTNVPRGMILHQGSEWTSDSYQVLVYNTVY